MKKNSKKCNRLHALKNLPHLFNTSSDLNMLIRKQDIFALDKKEKFSIAIAMVNFYFEELGKKMQFYWVNSSRKWYNYHKYRHYTYFQQRNDALY